MARNINLLLFIVTMLSFLLVCLIAFEVEISTFYAKKIPYQPTIFSGIGMVMSVILLPFVLSRWVSVRMSLKRSNTLFYAPLTPKGRRWLWLYGSMETTYSLAFGIAMYVLLSTAIVPAFVLIAKGLENMLYLAVNAKKSGICLTSDALVITQRSTRIIPLKHITKAEPRYDELHLIDDLGRNFIIPVAHLSLAHREAFLETFEQLARERKIYLSNDLRRIAESY